MSHIKVKRYTFIHSHSAIGHNCLNNDFGNRHLTKLFGDARLNLTLEQNDLNVEVYLLQSCLTTCHNFNDVYDTSK